MKKAVAECSDTDAPELELPPFRQPYRFINTLMKYADQMEEPGTLDRLCGEPLKTQPIYTNHSIKISRSEQPRSSDRNTTTSC